MDLRIGTVAIFVGLCGPPISQTWAEPLLQTCSETAITVSADNPDDARLACEVVADADVQLQQLGLDIHWPVRIQITQNVDVAPGICVALYSADESKIQVLPVDCLKGQRGRASAFPEMESELLFRSLIVHELTHAYMHQTSGGRFLPRVAYEYLAYAVQIEALPREEQSRILAKAAVEPPVDLMQLNDAVLDFARLRFAAMSWLHFRQEGGDAAHVRRIVEGELPFESLSE